MDHYFLGYIAQRAIVKSKGLIGGPRLTIRTPLQVISLSQGDGVPKACG